MQTPSHPIPNARHPGSVAPHAVAVLVGCVGSTWLTASPSMAATTQEIAAQQRAKELERVMKGAERGTPQEMDVGSFLLIGLLVVGVLTALFRN